MIQLTGNGIEPLEGVTDKDMLQLIRDLARLDEKNAADVIVNNPELLDIIKCPDAVQLEMIKLNVKLIGRIAKPSEVILQEVVRQGALEVPISYLPLDKPALTNFFKNATEVIQIALVKKSGFNIKYLENPAEAVQLAAVEDDGRAIQYIKNPTEAVQLAAVMQFNAVEGMSNAFNYINNPTEAVQLAAVMQNYWVIKDIKNPTEAVQLAAVKQHWKAIEYIKNPTEAAKMAVVGRNDADTEKINLALKSMKPKIMVQAATLKTQPPKLAH